jgi:hypothetical protein
VLEAEFADQRVEVLVSRAVTVLRSIPVEKLNEANRNVVAQALRDEARRYATRVQEDDQKETRGVRSDSSCAQRLVNRNGGRRLDNDN